MNTISLDVFGAGLPLATAVAYLPRTLDVTTRLTCTTFVLSVVISSVFSYRDAKAVHVVPGAMLLCVSI